MLRESPLSHCDSKGLLYFFILNPEGSGGSIDGAFYSLGASGESLDKVASALM
jgi:hypothetical protein